MHDIAEFATAKKHAVERFESIYLATLMSMCGGNVTHAARRAGMTRHHLRALLRARGLYGAAFPRREDETCAASVEATAPPAAQ